MEQYNVTGMSCAACSSRVEKAVAKQPGAQQVAVNLLKNSMVVEYDESLGESCGVSVGKTYRRRAAGQLASLMVN